MMSVKASNGNLQLPEEIPPGLFTVPTHLPNAQLPPPQHFIRFTIGLLLTAHHAAAAHAAPEQQRCEREEAKCQQHHDGQPGLDHICLGVLDKVLLRPLQHIEALRRLAEQLLFCRSSMCL